MKNIMVLEKMFMRKAIKTSAITCIWVCIGLVFEIIGPTLKDLKLKTNTNYEEVARAVSGLDIGGFFGAILGGILVDRFYGHWDLITAVFLDLSAITILFVPWTPDVNILWILFLFVGCTIWVLNMSGQKAILQLWQEDSSSALHLVHWGFGVGSFLIPVIANPFLAIPAPDSYTTFFCNETRVEPYDNFSEINFDISAKVLPQDNCTFNFVGDNKLFVQESRIEWAYFISGMTALLFSLSIYYYQFWGNKKLDLELGSSKNGNPFRNQRGMNYVLKMIDPQTCLKNQRIFGAFLLTLSFTFMFNIVGGERVYGRFVRSYAIDDLGMSGDDGSFLNTTFWVSFSFGRFLFFILSKFFHIRFIILIETVGALLTASIFCAFGGHSKTMLWVLTPPMGIFIGPLFPSCIGWVNYHLSMTGVGLMFILFGGTIGGVVHMWTIGYFYEYFGPISFRYHMLSYGAMVLVNAVILHITTRNLNHTLTEERKQISNIERNTIYDCYTEEIQMERKSMFEEDRMQDK